jgi:serine/threonine protein kinase
MLESLTILFVTYDAVSIGFQISLVDADSCPEFDRWLKQRRSKIAIDFGCIVKEGSVHRFLRDSVVDFYVFEERLMIGPRDGGFNKAYERPEDNFLIFMKSLSLSGWVEKSHLENAIENLIHFSHPCIVAPIGFVFRVDSAVQYELKIVRLFAEGGSLAEVISMNPEWWTATATATAVVGIVVGLRFIHSLGLVHDRLKSSHIHFSANHRIHIAKFGSIGLAASESKMGSFSTAGWTSQTDVRGFASIRFEVVVGWSMKGEPSLPPEIPEFVSKIIKEGPWSESETEGYFCDIFEILTKR